MSWYQIAAVLLSLWCVALLIERSERRVTEPRIVTTFYLRVRSSLLDEHGRPVQDAILVRHSRLRFVPAVGTLVDGTLRVLEVCLYTPEWWRGEDDVVVHGHTIVDDVDAEVRFLTEWPQRWMVERESSRWQVGDQR